MLQVAAREHEQLLDALWADTALLTGLGVMDYSLLVGVDQSRGTLVVAIIDFVRQVNPRFAPTPPLPPPFTAALGTLLTCSLLTQA